MSGSIQAEAIPDKLPVPRSAEPKWYYLVDEEQVGPLTEEEILHAARRGELKPETLVWHQTFSRWKPAASVPMIVINLGRHVRPLRSEAPPAQQKADPNREKQAKSPLAKASDAVEASLAVPSNEPAPTHGLHDAVSEEEAADPVIDAEQMRVILERTSVYPGERSIPPTSLAAESARDVEAVPLAFHGFRRVGFLAASVLVGFVAVLLLLRPPERRSDVDQTSTRIISEARDKPIVSQVSPAEGVDQSRNMGVKQATSETTASDSVDQRVSSSQRETHRGAAEAITQPASVDRSSRFVVVTSGPLGASLFQEKLDEMLSLFDGQCWDRLRAPGGEIAKDPSIVVEMIIDPWGRVYDAVPSQSPSGYRGSGRCIVGRMRGWRFPSADQATHASITVARKR